MRRKITPGLTVRGRKVTQFDIMDKAVADWRSRQATLGIPHVSAMVHQAEVFDAKAKAWAEETLPRILELADSACGGTDEQLISELAKAFQDFAEGEIAWRNAGKMNNYMYGTECSICHRVNPNGRYLPHEGKFYFCEQHTTQEVADWQSQAGEICPEK